MTEKNDETNNEQVEETLDSETTAATTEEWQSELPPEDDFHDQADLPADETEEEELLDEDGAIDEAEEQDSQQERAKRGKTIMFGVLVVGALLIGGVAYLQFAPSETSETGGRMPLASVMNANELKNLGKTPDGSKDQGVSAKSDAQSAEEGAIPSSSIGKPISAGATEILSSTDAPVPEQVAIPPVATQAVAVPPQAASPAPPPPALDVTKPVPTLSVQEMEKSVKEPTAALPPPPLHADALKPVPVALGTPEPAAAPAAAPAAPVPAMAAKPVMESPENAEMEARLKDMSAQVESLKKMLDETKAQNTTLLARLEVLQVQKDKEAENAARAMAQAAQKAEKEKAEAPAPATIELPAPADKAKAAAPAVKGKEDKAADNAMPREVGAYLNDAALHLNEAVKAEDKAKEKAAATARKKTTKAPATKKTAKKTPKAQERSPQWILRAATPEAAWVSISRDSMELRRVSVGENLPGIGRIRDIRPNGDRWEVVGETGTLR